MGGFLSGSARTVLDVARRRARLWLRPPGDVFRDNFLKALHHGGSTWASVSLQLLRRWGIPDYPDGPEDASYGEYIAFVKTMLFERCEHNLRVGCKSKTTFVKYNKLYDPDHALLSRALYVCLSWDCLKGIRSLVLIRSGIVVLSHKNRKRSVACLQYCVGCNEITDDACTHALLCCGRWAQQRSVIWSKVVPPERPNLAAAVSLLRTLPGDMVFEDVVALCSAIDATCSNFWREVART